ncbi:ABC transporter permease subunit [Streptomyces sp. YIM S03343]
MAAEAVETVHGRMSVTRFPGLVPVGRTARQMVRGALVWGMIFALVVWVLINEFANTYPTAADRARLVATMGSDVGQQAIFGPAHHLGTVAGYTAYHMTGMLGVMGGVWGLLASTRLLRGEEDAGRVELLLAGPTTRRRTTLGMLAGLGVGLLVLWAMTAAALVVFGRSADPPFSVSAGMFGALATVAATAMFLAVGALCSQLAATRRQAAAVAATVFGIAYLLRSLAYSGTSLRWLHWVTPLGWVDELRPLTASRPLVLVPIVGSVVALAALTVALAGRRDLGASVLPAHDTAVARTRLLNSPLGLALRLGLRTSLGWIGGLAVGGLVLGMSTRTIDNIWADSDSGGVIQRLAGAGGGDAYLGLLFLIVAVLVGLAAAGHVTATREEEAEGYLDHLLARPMARIPWLAGRFTVAAAALAGAGVATGLFTWLGATITGASVTITDLLAAGVNVVPVGVFVLGVGTLAHGLAPRFAGAVTYGVVAWSFLVEIVGAGLNASNWLLDLSVLHHIARAPAADVRWDSVAVLIALGFVAAAAGMAAFARRDLKGA